MFHTDRSAEDSPLCHTRRWENASVPLASLLGRLRLFKTLDHDFSTHVVQPQNRVPSLLHGNKRENKGIFPRCCLYSSRLSCLPPASVAAPITIPLFMMTKRFWFYDLLLPGSLQHHLFPSPHETISAVLVFFFCCHFSFDVLAFSPLYDIFNSL